ncbi:MAG: hypothetical protein ACOZQL_27640 [Myxococcota bacterium]
MLLVGFGVHAALLRRHTPQEGRVLTPAFLLHLVSGFGQVLLVRYYYGFGDMLEYYAYGVPIAEQFRSDPVTFGPALVQAFLHLEFDVPLEMPGGGSTLSMAVVAATLFFLLGNSLYAAVLALAVGSYVSKVLIYRALAPDFAPEQRRYVLMGATLLPTAAFWTSALLKEPVVMVAIGPLLLSLRWLSAGHRRAASLVMGAIAATVIAVIKPYVLMALSIAAALFYFWSRLFSKDAPALKPFALVTALVIGTGGFVLGNRFFAKSEGDSAAAALARQRMNAAAVEGGSNYALEGPGPASDATERSLANELALAPLAVFTALFRPVLFEARNVVQFANALEATFLLVLFVQILRARGVGGLLRAVRGSPTMLFCAVFTLALALGTGLASGNLGTLSRYRAPMMPFFFVLLLVLRYEREGQRQGALGFTLAGEAR